MCSKYSDTIAREQQIRESNHPTKIISSTSTARPRQDKSQTNEIIIIAILHIIFAIFILGRFTVNNESLIREAYYALIDTSNETFTETPSFLQTIR